MKTATDRNVATDTTELNPRDWSDGKASAQALRAAQARHSSGRRRFIDPATCERDYSEAEVEFMHAMQTYKHTSGRMFPTWSEVLEVIKALGYEKSEDCVPPAGDYTRRRAVAG